jgi:hypothetical protein
MRNRRAGALDVTVALDHANELFEPPGFDVAKGMPPRDSGVDRIRRELSSGSLPASARLVVEVPADQATPEIESGIRQAFARYCEGGIARAETELSALQREGRQTFATGFVVLTVSLVASDAILSSGAPKVIQDFFGNGLFPVAAWVGLWWPLETLIYSRRPYRLERKLFRVMQAMEVVVWPAGAPLGAPSQVPSL